MAVGLPMKTTYADGDVYSAQDVNDITGTINLTAAPYAAGKNKIINGDFGIWQRGTSITLASGLVTYQADRFIGFNNGNGTIAIERQTFTPGAAPVSGYESTFFSRVNISTVGTSTLVAFTQRIEDVRTFAGQNVTFSFWIKGSGSQVITTRIDQNFGAGGSASVNSSQVDTTVTANWTRITRTISLPSISGKTIGSNSYLGIRIDDNSPEVGTIDVWGVQLEAGSTATAFQTATGSIQGELAVCQRYFQIYGGTQNYELIGSSSVAANSTTAYAGVDLLVEMRTVPSIVTSFYSNVNEFTLDGGNANYRLTALSLNSGSSAKKVR
jgi:hypothetical protein